MASKSSRKNRKPSRRKAARRPKSGEAPRPRRKRPDPIKSMLLGAVLFGLLCAFFVVPISGATGFTHMIRLITPVEQPADEIKAKDSKKQGRAALTAREQLSLT